jgi:hypothetical protein
MRRAAKPVTKSQVSSIKPADKIKDALPNDRSPRNYSTRTRPSDSKNEDLELGMEYENMEHPEQSLREYSPKALVVGLDDESEYPFLNLIKRINMGTMTFDLVQTKNEKYSFYVRVPGTSQSTTSYLSSEQEVVPRNVVTSLLKECKPECLGVAIYDAVSDTTTFVVGEEGDQSQDSVVVKSEGTRSRVPLPIFSKEDLTSNKTKTLELIEKVSKRLLTAQLKICDRNLDALVATYNDLHHLVLNFVQKCDSSFEKNPEVTIKACEDVLDMTDRLSAVAELLKVATNTLK